MPKVVFNAEMKELLDNSFADNETPRRDEVDTPVVSILLLDPNWPIADDTDNEALAVGGNQPLCPPAMGRGQYSQTIGQRRARL